jgi:hypothetical protein
MTREQVEAILAKLHRYECSPEDEGMLHESGGKYVRYDDVQEVLEGMIDRKVRQAPSFTAGKESTDGNAVL